MKVKITSKKVMAIFGVLLFAAVITAASGCVGTDPIVGTWQSDENINVIIASAIVEYTFNEDNSGEMNFIVNLFGIKSKEKVCDLTWTKDGDHYKITNKRDGSTEVFTLKYNVLKDSDTNTYHKI